MAVNSDGKTNKATKQTNEPLKLEQVKPTENQQKKQEEKKEETKKLKRRKM